MKFLDSQSLYTTRGQILDHHFYKILQLSNVLRLEGGILMVKSVSKIYLIDHTLNDFMHFWFQLLFLLLYIPIQYHEDDILKWRYFHCSFWRNYISCQGSEPSYKISQCSINDLFFIFFVGIIDLFSIILALVSFLYVCRRIICPVDLLVMLH